MAGLQHIELKGISVDLHMPYWQDRAVGQYILYLMMDTFSADTVVDNV